MATGSAKATTQLALILTALACLGGGALLIFQSSPTPATSTSKGWTEQEKAAYLDLAEQCPQTECLAAWWHPGIRSVIVEVPKDLQRVSAELQSDSTVYLNAQMVHEGTLPDSVTEPLLRLPQDADRVPVIPESKPLLPAELDTLMQHVSQCVSNRQGVGVRDHFITITLDSLMDALAQGRTPSDFFNNTERDCINDLLKQGYHITYEEYVDFPAL